MSATELHWSRVLGLTLKRPGWLVVPSGESLDHGAVAMTVAPGLLCPLAHTQPHTSGVPGTSPEGTLNLLILCHSLWLDY